MLVLALFPGDGMAQVNQPPRRVVSLNLCTDQLLLTLADREQIASLSHLARDPTISFLADQAAGLPLNQGRGEAILLTGADLVLTGTYGQKSRATLLREQGLDVLELGPWESLRDGQAQIRLAARSLGQPERGEKLIADIEAALQRSRAIAPEGRSILAYDRMGWVPGANSLMGEILSHMGFVLHQRALGLQAGGMARLEQIVASPPDYLLVGDTGQAIDIGSSLFVHPALLKLIPMDHHLVLPGKLSICGGPSTAAMIDALAAEVKARLR